MWVFLSAPAPAALVRSWLLPFCPADVEFYPKQDGASSEHPGSLVRVPFGVHRRSGRRYPFVAVGSAGRLAPVVSSVGDGLRWLSTVKRATAPTVPAAPSVPQHDHVPPPIQKKYPAKTALGGLPRLPAPTIRDWCAAQNPFVLIGRYVQLDNRGIGYCPFGWHHSDGRDSHPSLKVYEPTYPGGYSWYCHTWGRGGSIFDFLLLYHNFETYVLWRRILAGDNFRKPGRILFVVLAVVVSGKHVFNGVQQFIKVEWFVDTREVSLLNFLTMSFKVGGRDNGGNRFKPIYGMQLVI